MPSAPPSVPGQPRPLVLAAALLAVYLASFFLPVLDNGETNHMDPRPRGVVSGGSAFLRSGSLLLSLLTGSPMTAGMQAPQLPFLWLALAWLANPLFWTSAGLLVWRKNKTAAVVAAAATFLALNARVALRDESVVRDQQFLGGYYVWLAAMALLTAAALWRWARGPAAAAADPRPVPRAFAMTAVASALLALVLGAGHWAAGSLTRFVPLRSAAEFSVGMRSPDPDERLRTLYRVSELHRSSTEEVSPGKVAGEVLRAVDDPDPRVRAAACMQLPYLKPSLPEAVPALRRRLADKDPKVRSHAAFAVWQLCRGRGEWPEEQRAAGEVIAGELARGERAERIAMLDRLTMFGPDAGPLLPAVAGRLDDPDPFVRGMAVRALQRISPPGPPELLQALDDPDPQVVRFAVEAAEQMGPAARTHVAELGRLARERDSLIGGPAARALVKIGPEAVPELVRALDSKDSAVRQRGAESLGQIGAAAEPALPELERLREDDVPAVKAAASRAVEAIRAAGSAPPADGELDEGQ